MKTESEEVLRQVAEDCRRLASALGFVPESAEVMVHHLQHEIFERTVSMKRLPHPAIVVSGPQLNKVIEDLEAGTYPQPEDAIWRDDLPREIAIRLAKATGASDEQIAEIIMRKCRFCGKEIEKARAQRGPAAWATADRNIDGPWVCQSDASAPEHHHEPTPEES